MSVASLLAARPVSASAPRVVVLGFDGADHALVKKMMDEGKLPNLSALAKKGGFTQLLPTIPAQTPVSWSTFSTGLSPGRTLIFDFLKRNPKTYRPEFAIAEEGKKDFLLGKGNRVGIPAVLGLLAFVLVAGLWKILLRRRERGLGTPLAAWLPRPLFTFIGIQSPLLPTLVIPPATNNRRGPCSGARGRGNPPVVMHAPVTFPAVVMTTDASSRASARWTCGHRNAVVLHVGPVFRPEEQERVLRQPRPPESTGTIQTESSAPNSSSRSLR